jgi:hypothetical protein
VLRIHGDKVQWAFNPAIQGFAATLAHAYVRNLDVINGGYSGFNTVGPALSILPLLLQALGWINLCLALMHLVRQCRQR